MTYNQDDGFFYALNYYGAHRLDIYSSAEERPESDDEKRVRIERERHERNRKSKLAQGATGGSSYSDESPKSFLCPITCDLMMDPVIACDGH